MPRQHRPRLPNATARAFSALRTADCGYGCLHGRKATSTEHTTTRPLLLTTSELSHDSCPCCRATAARLPSRAHRAIASAQRT